MLLLHQIGSVKIGDIVRYSVTYTPAHDRILPAPEHLYLRIRNTSNSALRAAFVHGPYTLYVDAYPAHFDPNEKFEQPRQYGVPEFEPMLKAGGTWTCRLLIPESIRYDAGSGGNGDSAGGRGRGSDGQRDSEEFDKPPSVSWIINVSSQVIFSTSAAVHYEVLLARDPKSLDIGGGISAGIPVILGGGGGDNGGSSSGKGSGGGGSSHGQVLLPGKVSDYQRGRDGRHPDQPKGVFSRAVQLRVEDTGTLWNKPQLPGWDNPPSTMRVRTSDKDATSLEGPSGSSTSHSNEEGGQSQQHQEQEQQEIQETLEQSNESKGQARQQARTTIPAPKPGHKPRKVHLVVLTHGLHGNLGNDMLYIKESIDLAVQKAKVDRKARLAKERAARAEAREKAKAEAAAANGGDAVGGEESKTEIDEGEEEDDDDDDNEEVIVRGYSGNATRTERGIKYLGKRLARYVLSTTYPDQPFLPSSKALAEKTSVALHGGNAADVPTGDTSHSSHKRSTIYNSPTESQRNYKFTKISFIAHSLGGLVQTYAVAYIQKHSPQFFDLIKPINFIGMASPFLGLNHENPMYVKFALDFGLVGRTGQDLGLTWRAPTIARSGWGALMSNLSENAHKKVLGETQPESKPLLRILPTGPAHTALKKFRNRTIYSNVVNDGIVPLRTSCLLFLDWQGLERVEKARREVGLMETVVGFGWAELVGTNVTTPRAEKWQFDEEGSTDNAKIAAGQASPGTGASASGVSDSQVPDVERLNEHEVPQPSKNATQEDDRQSLRAVSMTTPFAHEPDSKQASPLPSPNDNGDAGRLSTASTNNSNPFSNFFNNLFKNNEDPTTTPDTTTSSSPPAAKAPGTQLPNSSPEHQDFTPKPLSHSTTSLGGSSKHNKIYQRSQTLRPDGTVPSGRGSGSASSSKSRVTTGHELGEEAVHKITGDGPVSAPPRTSFFESATDIINPKLPSVEFLIDPAKRPRAIFHDRIYHPSDIPAPPLKRRPTGGMALRRLSFQQRSKSNLSNRSGASSSPYRERTGAEHQDSGLSTQDYDDPANNGNSEREPEDVVDNANMKVEEKIARAYHRGLSWRKVLVKLEPDAHNNMAVRRTFSNAFGWPVVKHMVDAHFSDEAEVQRREEDEKAHAERGRRPNRTPHPHTSRPETQKEEEENKEAEEDEGEEDESDENDDIDTGKRTAAPARDSRLYAHEAEDQAMALPTAAAAMSPGGRSPISMRQSSLNTRGSGDGVDSVTWSDRDWNDSGDESDGQGGGKSGGSYLTDSARGKKKQGKEERGSQGSLSGVSVTATGGTTTGPMSPLKNLLPQAVPNGSPPLARTGAAAGSPSPQSPSSWNWKEKIVGRSQDRSGSGRASKTTSTKRSWARY